MSIHTLTLKKITNRMNDVQNKRNIGFPIRSMEDYGEIYYTPFNNTIEIYFSGSDFEYKDWFGSSGNLNYFDKDFNGVHDGFQKAYHNIQHQIYAYFDWILYHKLTFEKRKSLSIRISGYSRGGALATICSADIKKKFSDFTMLDPVLFGTPPVFNEKAKIKYLFLGITPIRVINGWDIVTTSRLYKEVDLHHVGIPYKLYQPFWHLLLSMKIKDHFFESGYLKNINKL